MQGIEDGIIGGNEWFEVLRWPWTKVRGSSVSRIEAPASGPLASASEHDRKL